MTEHEPKSGKFVCQGCGWDEFFQEELEPWDCSYCGYRVVHVAENEVVPIEELEELVDEWLDESLTTTANGPMVYTRTSQEVQELIEEYTND